MTANPSVPYPAPSANTTPNRARQRAPAGVVAALNANALPESAQYRAPAGVDAAPGSRAEPDGAAAARDRRSAAAPAALRTLDERELVAALRSAVADERRRSADVILHLAEMDRRGTSADLGYSSLYLYCVRALGYSENAAYEHLHAARAARRFPRVADLVAEGALSLTAASMLAPFLTPENQAALLAASRGKTRRELEEDLASLAPRPDIADRISRRPATFIPAGRPASAGAGPGIGPALSNSAPSAGAAENTDGMFRLAPECDKVLPISQERVHVGFTGSLKLRGLLDRARELLRHKHPLGRLEDVFLEALEALLDKIDPARKLIRKAAREAARLESGQAAQREVRRTTRPKTIPATGSRAEPDSAAAAQDGRSAAAPGSKAQPDGAAARRVVEAGRPVLPDVSGAGACARRQIPQAVKDEVWARDGGRCAFRGTEDLRCEERGSLEFDHVKPWALGGPSDDPGNIRLLCRTHNQSLAQRQFGVSSRPQGSSGRAPLGRESELGASVNKSRGGESAKGIPP